MNDEGDIQLVDDMQMFSHHESARYDEDREGDELEYQTNDIEDSSRIRLMPPHRDNTFHLDDHYEEKEPLSLQIKSKLQTNKKLTHFSNSL